VLSNARTTHQSEYLNFLGLLPAPLACYVRPMLVYRYLPAEFALLAIQEQRLRVGRIDKLNDVFECWPRIVSQKGITRDEVFRMGRQLIADFANIWGSISYCATAESVLVWSHYGDAHRGIALGFDLGALREKKPGMQLCMINEIVYVEDDKRPTIAIRHLKKALSKGYDDTFDDAIFTSFLRKGKDWAYEQEYRELIPLDGCDLQGASYFSHFRPRTLRRIVLGARCSIDATTIYNSLEFAKHSIGRDNVIERSEIKRAYADTNAFRITLRDAFSSKYPDLLI